jgi:CRISPR-associated protein Cmr4
MQQKILYLTAVSSVHNGAGRGLGAIDNPILRQRDTHLPIIQGSSIKGVLREDWEDDQNKKRILFGPGPQENTDFAGAVSIGDAHLLLFPVRSLRGAFVWTASPLTLALYQKHLRFAGIILDSLDALMKKITQESIASSDILACQAGAEDLKAEKYVVLEEYAYKIKDWEEVKKFAEQLAGLIFHKDYPAFLKEKFKKHLVILPEDDFQYFITFATEVTPNIRINESGATQDGSLRYTEYLPAQSILYSLWSIDKGRSSTADTEKLGTPEEVWKAVKDHADKKGRVQIGGDATVGKGLIELNFHELKKEG